MPSEILIPDLMHDLIGGVMSFHMTNLIRSLHSGNVVLLPKTIQSMSRFSLGRNDKKAKPRKISPKLMRKKCHLVGSASERWTLFRIFSLVLGNLVPEDNKHWQLYLLGNRIFDIILAPIIEEGWLAVLDDLVREHHELWVQLYPRDCKYKWHVLIHYARIISSVGSLRHLWTMRFEAFHQFFKRTARKLNNYINISKTLSYRFQKRRAVETCESWLPEKLKLVGRQVSVPLKGERPEVCSAICATFDAGEDEEVCWVRGVIFCGLHLYRDDVVILDVAEDGAPLFLTITDLYIVHGRVAILGQLTYVTAWNGHLHAYEVHVSEGAADFACVPAERILSPQTLDRYCIERKMYVKLRFAVARRMADSA
jgi:hypothetical protein